GRCFGGTLGLSGRVLGGGLSLCVFGVTPPPSPDAQGKVRDPQLVRLFLATHPWYLPQAEVAGKLLTLVQESGGSAEGPSLRLKIGHLVR
ncbi:GRP2 protein, partial [Molothrus ater]|nr:GRP2 protein [Molothrus ater]